MGGDLLSDLIPAPNSLKNIITRGIRTVLLDNGSATKAELSETLGISFPTITKFLAQMMKEGEITSAGLDDSSGGRRAERYVYNPEHRLGLAVFLEKTETNYLVFNCMGEVKNQGAFAGVLQEDGLSALTHTIGRLCSDYPKLGSLAIGVPGSVKNGRIFYIPGYEQYQNFDLKSFYEQQFSLPVIVENDMNAAVLGYHHKTGSKEGQSLVYLYAGQNGPGAGILMNGDVVRGSTFFSGEVSFVPLYDGLNFQQALETREENTDAMSRLIASFTAIINPHTFILCSDEADQAAIDKIAERSRTYIPSEHLPALTLSDWKQDYLYGLQRLGLELLLNEPAN